MSKKPLISFDFIAIIIASCCICSTLAAPMYGSSENGVGRKYVANPKRFMSDQGSKTYIAANQEERIFYDYNDGGILKTDKNNIILKRIDFAQLSRYFKQNLYRISSSRDWQSVIEIKRIIEAKDQSGIFLGDNGENLINHRIGVVKIDWEGKYCGYWGGISSLKTSSETIIGETWRSNTTLDDFSVDDKYNIIILYAKYLSTSKGEGSRLLYYVAKYGVGGKMVGEWKVKEDMPSTPDLIVKPYQTFDINKVLLFDHLKEEYMNGVPEKIWKAVNW